jgi:hypothetical protein
MKPAYLKSHRTLIFAMLLTSMFLIDCKKNEEHVNFPVGVFPDTVLNLTGLNSAFDDYNSTIDQITGSLPIIFSSNRKSSGGQFDLEQGLITFTFNTTDGRFEISSAITQNFFLSSLITKAVTPGNDFGPYSIYSSLDGLEYFILSSENTDGNLDLWYCNHVPYFGTGMPEIYGTYPVNLINTGFDDAYLAFDMNLDTAYFTSNIEGFFDIYLKSRPSGQEISAWFNSDYSPSSLVDSINSTSNDMCPMVYNKLMVFTSDRPGGNGGYDLYYSVFRNGNWSSPVNFGPEINSSSDEYRPLIGYHSDFSNLYMIFSSNRPGGAGGYDLYFTGVESPDQQ